jgi:lactate 2-monooxygenase
MKSESKTLRNRLQRHVSGLVRQTAIYLGGVSGRRPRVPVDAGRLEEKAEELMRREAFAYVAAGAGGEGTLRANREAFHRWRIVPRMLRDVSQRDTGIELFGRRLDSPFLLAPIGVLELAHRQADLAVARAARAEGVPMIFSSQASRPMEACAQELGDSPRWLQLYWSSSDELVESFVSRAEACGCEAIAVTLDTTILGWRPRDLEPAYLPFLRGKGIAQYTSDPVFRRLASEGADPDGPQPRPTLSALRTLFQVRRASDLGRSAVQRFIQVYSRPSLTWDELPFLRDRTRLPILLKGILHPDDARRALDAGVDGIVVSNHGGRQVDGAVATLDALPGVVEVVAGRVPILLDSGMRGGADAFKALALGATAVLIGRSYVYGLALAGEEGVREVIQNHKAEFDLTMGLSGCTSVAEIGPDCVVEAATGARTVG